MSRNEKETVVLGDARIRNVSEEFLKFVKDQVAMYPNSFSYTLFMRELLNFTRDELAFISKRVQKYSRGSYRLRPRSFTQFLIDKKYQLDDAVVVAISVDDLVKEGVMKIVEKNGFHYWVVGDEVLNPLEYKKLYKLDKKTFATLLREAGYLDIYNRFKDQIMPADIGWVEKLGSFTYKGIHFELYEGYLHASTSIGFPVKELGYEEGERKNVSVWINIHNAKGDDVDKIVNYVSELEKKVQKVILDLQDKIRRETRIIIPESKFWGSISVKDYKIEDFYVTGEATLSINRKEVSVKVTWKPIKKVFEAEITGRIKSYYAAKTFDEISLESLGIEVPSGYYFTVDRSEKTVVLKYYKEFENVEQLPSIAEPYEIVSNVDKVMREIVKMYIEKSKNEKIIGITKGYYRYDEFDTGFTIGKLVESLNWDPEADSFDAIVVKLIAAKIQLPSEHRPRVFDYLVTQVVLNGHSQDKLMEKVNNSLETIFKYMERGRLTAKFTKVEENGYEREVIRLYLDGKPLGIKVEDLPEFEKMIYTAKILQMPIEEETPAKKILV